jgi:hypothetical protein
MLIFRSIVEFTTPTRLSPLPALMVNPPRLIGGAYNSSTNTWSFPLLVVMDTFPVTSTRPAASPKENAAPADNVASTTLFDPGNQSGVVSDADKIAPDPRPDRQAAGDRAAGEADFGGAGHGSPARIAAVQSHVSGVDPGDGDAILRAVASRDTQVARYVRSQNGGVVIASWRADIQLTADLGSFDQNYIVAATALDTEIPRHNKPLLVRSSDLDPVVPLPHVHTDRSDTGYGVATSL